MADALCGPSNALQNLKHHAQVDRSLQQDRFAGPRAPIQGFRSHDPRAGSLDADFHAFENASASPFPEPIAASALPPRAQLYQPSPADWANDFQHLSIAEQPVSTQQFRSVAPLIRTTNGGWQNEFMRQQQSGQSFVAQGKQAVYEQQSVSAYSSQMQYRENYMSMQSAVPQFAGQQPLEITQAPAADQIEGVDWSQAFEEAFQDAFDNTTHVEQSNIAGESRILHEDGTYTNDHSEQIDRMDQVDQVRIGSDAIDYTEMKDRTADHDVRDASALARVAGELLHNVQHDSSEKFQNSLFLDLMRKIRDRQVEVRGNEFEQTTHGSAQEVVQPDRNLTMMIAQDARNAPDPLQNEEGFAFPNMNTVYAPHKDDSVDYTFDSDQFPAPPRNQILDLHPGGKLYPYAHPESADGDAQMSGAVPSSDDQPRNTSNTILTRDFDAAYDENRNLANRSRSPSA